MARGDQKAEKRARKKAEEAQKKREREQKRKTAPQRILTDYARSIVANFPESSSKRQQFERNFYLFLLRVQRLPFAEAWQEAVEHIAKAMKETIGMISCARGCSACCHQHVGLSKAEGELIREFLQKQPLELDWERLDEQCQARDWKRLPFAARRCVFLGQEGECRIYEVRPLTCRRYFVTSNPAYCHEEATDKLQSSLNLDCDAYLSAFLTQYGHLSLPEFLQGLKKES